MIPSLPVAPNGKSHVQPTEAAKGGTVILRASKPEDVESIWGWLQEYPKASFDDYGPKTLEEFHAGIVGRLKSGELLVVAELEGKPIGTIAYAPITERLGSLHGICFTKFVHGTGAPYFAVSRFLDKLFSNNTKIEKICACYFQDNSHIKPFLKKLGFIHEGTLVDHTVRHGIRINQTLVALHKRDWRKVN
jgi:RimJ/RimL family protein N-acetyltransferase